MKGINIKDRDFILYNTPPKVGKSYISYIDIIDQLVKENKDLKNIIKNTTVELEILLQSEDFELITMQLRNIVFRLKGEDKE